MAKSAAAKAAPKKSAPAAKKSASGSGRGPGIVRAKGGAAEGLKDLFIDQLKDIYGAEKALLKALPEMAKNATDEDLATAITEHVEVTENQIARLEEVFSLMEEKAVAKKCEAMAGLVKEGEEIMQSTQQGPVRDAGIISAGQKIEHYEIATYGTLAAFARILGEDDAVKLLEETLEEEKEADQNLTDCAEDAINIEASEEDEEED